MYSTQPPILHLRCNCVRATCVGAKCGNFHQEFKKCIVQPNLVEPLIRYSKAAPSLQNLELSLCKWVVIYCPQVVASRNQALPQTTLLEFWNKCTEEIEVCEFVMSF